MIVAAAIGQQQERINTAKLEAGSDELIRQTSGGRFEEMSAHGT
jgi:hypothetical protein